MKSLERYLDKKDLTLNVKKSKMMVFEKGRSIRQKQGWKWKGEELEMVKEFNYLGIVFQRNGKMTRHVEERIKRANVVLNQVWGIGERKFKTDFKMRMFLFESLVFAVLLYGAELWGYQDVEKLNLTYIKWTGHQNTRIYCPGGNEENKRMVAGNRALMFEEKVRKGTGRLLVKECLKEKEERKQKTKSGKEKEEYVKKERNEHVGAGAGKNTREKCQDNSRKIKQIRQRKTGTNTVQQNSEITIQ